VTDAASLEGLFREGDVVHLVHSLGPGTSKPSTALPPTTWRPLPDGPAYASSFDDAVRNALTADV
jgi:hypothetical protein